MKIDQVMIEKFRSIEKCKLSIDTINAIVGQNNSGKSATLRALNAFFNPDEEKYSFYEGKHNYTSKSKCKITIKFIEIPENDEIQQFTFNNCLEVQLHYSHTTKTITYKYKKENRFINAPLELMPIIYKYITFVYIPPNRSEEQLVWQEKSLIKQLIEEFLKQETRNRDTITPKFTKATNFLEQNALRKISKEIESCYSLRHKFEFSLNFDNDTNFLSFLSEIQMYINESGSKHNLKDCGTGLQSLTIIAFHRALAKMRNRNIVLGLEEPEINLHPQAQRELIKSIKNSSNDNDISQVIITTHSTVMIDNIEHTNISLVRKTHDEKRGFKSTITKTSDNFFTKYNLEEFKYYQFHSYRNSDFFFANYVIFVESKNDAEIVKHLANRENIDLDLYGISLVNIDGVKNLPYPYRIVKELKIPHLIILDKDYFLPYLNDSLDNSRGENGLPKYKNSFQTNNLINELIPNQRQRGLLLNSLKVNHSRALEILEDYNIVCMMYNLEVDLLCSSKGVEEMSNILSLRPQQSNLKYLLTERNKAIKNIHNMLEVLSSMTNRNLPNSFRKIKKNLIQITKEY